MNEDRFSLPTILGTVFIDPDGLTSVRVHCVTPNGRVNPIQYKGVDLSFAVNLVFEHDEWRTELVNRIPMAWNVHRPDVPPNVQTPVSTIRAVKNAVLSAVTAFHLERPDAFVSAERAKLAGYVDDCEADVDQARVTLRLEEAALVIARDRLSAFNAEYPMPVSVGARR